MTESSHDKVFAGSVPQIYNTYLVPLIFETYAADVVRRVTGRHPQRLLEIAAGTGVVTRALSKALPDTTIVATDLNQAMLDQAAAHATPHPVEWRQADATSLPFEDASFDVVVCQFGVMFFPDKAKAFSEARRVLRDGGVYVFNVWDRIEDNDFANIVTSSLATMFTDDPPRFLARTPHGYHDRATIARDLVSGGFSAAPEMSGVAARSRATSARIPAVAFCQGTPLRGEIEARDAIGLERATEVATAAIAKAFGHGAVDGRIQALVVAVTK